MVSDLIPAGPSLADALWWLILLLGALLLAKLQADGQEPGGFSSTFGHFRRPTRPDSWPNMRPKATGRCDQGPERA